ncbi:Spo0E family sporulation regulatory protein-aspartic acid phosphatase, partial [Bacillus paralicheniformis]
MVNLLLKQMEQTREMMIRSGVENGLQNANTIQ